MDGSHSRQAFCNKISKSIVEELNKSFKTDAEFNNCLLQRTRHATKKKHIGFIIPNTIVNQLRRQFCSGCNYEYFNLALSKCIQTVFDESKSWDIPISLWENEKNGSYVIYPHIAKALSYALKEILNFEFQPVQSLLTDSSVHLLFCHISRSPLVTDIRSLLYCRLVEKMVINGRTCIHLTSDGALDEPMLKELGDALNLSVNVGSEEDPALVPSPTHFSDCLSSDDTKKYANLRNIRCYDNATAFTSRVTSEYKNKNCCSQRQNALKKFEGKLQCIHTCNHSNKMMAQQTELYHAWCEDELRFQTKEKNDSKRFNPKEMYLSHAGVRSDQGMTAVDFLAMRKGQIKESFEAKLQVNLEGEKWETMFEKMRAAIIKLEFMKTTATNKLTLMGEDTLPTDATFVLYNYSRLSMLLDSHARKIEEGVYPPLPPFDEIDFGCLVEGAEWELFIDHIWTFHDVISRPLVTCDGCNLKTHCHLLVDYLQHLCRSVSTFYSRHHIMGENLPHLLPTMNARIYLMQAAKKAMYEAFNALEIEPLAQM